MLKLNVCSSEQLHFWGRELLSFGQWSSLFIFICAFAVATDSSSFKYIFRIRVRFLCTGNTSFTPFYDDDSSTIYTMKYMHNAVEEIVVLNRDWIVGTNAHPFTYLCIYKAKLYLKRAKTWLFHPQIFISNHRLESLLIITL